MLSSLREIQLTSTKARGRSSFYYSKSNNFRQPSSFLSLSFNSFDISEDDGTKTIGKDKKRRANCSGRNIKNKNPKKVLIYYISRRVILLRWKRQSERLYMCRVAQVSLSRVSKGLYMARRGERMRWALASFYFLLFQLSCLFLSHCQKHVLYLAGEEIRERKRDGRTPPSFFFRS